MRLAWLLLLLAGASACPLGDDAFGKANVVGLRAACGKGGSCDECVCEFGRSLGQVFGDVSRDRFCESGESFAYCVGDYAFYLVENGVFNETVFDKCSFSTVPSCVVDWYAQWWNTSCTVPGTPRRASPLAPDWPLGPGAPESPPAPLVPAAPGSPARPTLPNVEPVYPPAPDGLLVPSPPSPLSSNDQPSTPTAPVYPPPPDGLLVPVTPSPPTPSTLTSPTVQPIPPIAQPTSHATNTKIHVILTVLCIVLAVILG